MTTTELEQLADRVRGMAYGDPRAEAILNEEDWAQHWPVVRQADGLDYEGEDEDDEYYHGPIEGLVYTGEVVSSDDSGWLNVQDMAAIWPV